ncbi:MAG: DUF3732 domain-containing protein [Methylococcaceae bacterium]
MIFYFKKVILWLKNDKRREICFEPNKVNVITGESNTGKSAILQIIDYCLFASNSKISESRINENVSWYGIDIVINNKNYTICRKALFKGNVSKDYYFSSSGEIPEFPEVNNNESAIKSLLETEFDINHNIVMPYGGRVLSSGSKISLRYFLMFTTISQNIITDSDVFFDKQSETRYKEALERIFDLAVGIDTIDNIIKREKKSKLDSDIKALERKGNTLQKQKNEFQDELNEISRKAKEFGLIEPDVKIEDTIQQLKLLVEKPILVETTSNQYAELQKEELKHNKAIRNLKRFKKGYHKYKETLDKTKDSVLPIKFLRNKKDEIIKNSIYQELISALESDLDAIRNDVKKKTPIDINVTDLIYQNEQALIEIRNQLSILPREVTSFNNDKEKYIFIGEVKSNLRLYDNAPKTDYLKIKSSIEELKNEFDSLIVREISESRAMIIKILEEIIQEYIKFSGKVLENYADYYPHFDYAKKQLLLRKPHASYIENAGSSSNHMFLHLFLFLGIHEVIHREDINFVPSYLIIDQPSRPYWADGKKTKEKLEHGDEFKIRKAFELLNFFVKRIMQLNRTCQIIVFEHVPETTWEDLEYFHLVEEFTSENPLVPIK